MTVPACHAWPSNAELIVDVASLYYRYGDLVIDLTYGEGVWWKKFRPVDLTINLHPNTPDDKMPDAPWASAIARMDYRWLDDSMGGQFDVVAYDPPYVCASLDTEILTKRGWLTWDGVQVGDEAYALDPETGEGTWAHISDVHLLPVTSRRLREMEGQSHSSCTTLDHRWVVLDAKGRRHWRTSESFRVDDLVPCAAPSRDLPITPSLSDELVELLAWWWAEGNVDHGGRAGANGAGGYGTITQSHAVNPGNCARIEAALGSVFGPATPEFPRVGKTTDGVPRWRTSRGDRITKFVISADAGRLLNTFMPDMVPTWGTLFRFLTVTQLEAWVLTTMKAEGSSRGLSQRSVAMAESFALACALLGRRVSIRRNDAGMTHVEVMTSRGFKPSRQASNAIVERDCAVWCVTTSTGTWMARRKGSTYFTGNCVGGRTTTTIPDMHDRFGLTNAARTPQALHADNTAGLAEATRICKPGGYLWVKCMPYISSAKRQEADWWARDEALELGLIVEDQFIHAGDFRPQPSHNVDGTPRRQVHARNNYSCLWIFRKPGRRSRRT